MSDRGATSGLIGYDRSIGIIIRTIAIRRALHSSKAILLVRANDLVYCVLGRVRFLLRLGIVLSTFPILALVELLSRLTTVGFLVHNIR